MKLRTIDDLEISGKRILLRADFNVPLDKQTGAIQDDFRIRAALPTLDALRNRGARQIVLCSHLGRPKGEPNAKDSLAPVAQRLSEVLGMHVPLTEHSTGPVPDAPIVLLENLRFNKGEQTNDIEFARSLAALADEYVDDAFGAVHRAHASVSAVASLLPSAAGLLLAKEVSVLTGLLEQADRPFVAVLGGAKVSDKLNVIENLLTKVDRLLIGGAMCFTFYLAQGLEIGNSLAEPGSVETVKALLRNEKLVIPTDVVVGKEPKAGTQTREVKANEIPKGMAGYDIGSQTCRTYVDEIRKAKTVFWNGPMGIFEIPPFDKGTRAVAAAIAKGDAFSVIGGGDSASALGRFGYVGEIDHMSTGGGASLELLEGKTLPGLQPLLV